MPEDPGFGVEIEFDLLDNHMIWRVWRSATQLRRVNS